MTPPCYSISTNLVVALASSRCFNCYFVVLWFKHFSRKFVQSRALLNSFEMFKTCWAFLSTAKQFWTILWNVTTKSPSTNWPTASESTIMVTSSSKLKRVQLLFGWVCWNMTGKTTMFESINSYTETCKTLRRETNGDFDFSLKYLEGIWAVAGSLKHFFISNHWKNNMLI